MTKTLTEEQKREAFRLLAEASKRHEELEAKRGAEGLTFAEQGEWLALAERSERMQYLLNTHYANGGQVSK